MAPQPQSSPPLKILVFTPEGWKVAHLELGGNTLGEVGLLISLDNGTGMTLSLPPYTGKALAVALIHRFGVDALRDWSPDE